MTDFAQPPRLTGNSDSDFPALVEWLWAYYRQSILERGLLPTDELTDEIAEQLPTLSSLGALNGTPGGILAFSSPTVLISSVLLTLGAPVVGGGAAAAPTPLAPSAVATRYLANTGALNAAAWDQVNLSNGVSNVLPVANGGTNISSYTIGDLLQASAATTLAKLPAVATGSALISGGIGTISSWGKIGLTTHVSGVLPIANGGTNQSTWTANQIVYAPSTNVLGGNAGLTYNGTTLSSAAGTIVSGSALSASATFNATAAGTYNIAGITLTVSPSVAPSSGAQWRSLIMSTQFNTAENIGSTYAIGAPPTAAWFEPRIINAGTIAEVAGQISYGLYAAGAAASLGTVGQADAILAVPVLSFTNVLATTISNVSGVRVKNSTRNTFTITRQAGLIVEALTAGTNNTDLLLGTGTIPTGDFCIYAANTDPNYFASSVLIGSTAAYGRVGQSLEVTTSATYGGQAFNTFSATADQASLLDFNRSKSATLGTYTVVASGDRLGSIIFRGSDGTVFRNAASISAHVDGTPGAADMPGRLTFATTADGASASTERMRITSAGNVGIGETTPTAVVHVKAGTAVASTGQVKLEASTLLATPEAGLLERVTDDIHFTIGTGTARKKIVLDDGTALNSGRVPYATTNGRLTDSVNLTFGTVLGVGVPIDLAGYTVGTLPTGAQGYTAFVTDALAPAFLTPVVGGGAVVAPVFHDGTNWVAI